MRFEQCFKLRKHFLQMIFQSSSNQLESYSYFLMQFMLYLWMNCTLNNAIRCTSIFHFLSSFMNYFFSRKWRFFSKCWFNFFGKDKLVDAPNCCYVSVGSQLSNSLKRIKLCRTSVKLFIFLLLQKIDAPSWILTFFLKTTIPYSLSLFASDINVSLLLRFLKLAVSGTQRWWILRYFSLSFSFKSIS